MLAFMDRNTHEVVGTVDPNTDALPHPVGNINEIRCISENDGSHGTENDIDIPWADLRFSKNDAVYRLLLKPSRAIVRKGAKFLRDMK